MSAASSKADSIRKVVKKLNHEALILWGSGKYRQAIQKYQEAIDAGGNNPCILIPFSNVAAAFYDLGKYVSCIQLAKVGLDVMRTRIPLDEEAIERFKLQIKRAKALIPNASKDEKRQRRLKIAASLPRHCVSLDETRECFPIEENVPESLFYALFSHSAAVEDRKISFFLGGTGDARSLFATLLHLLESEKEGIAHSQKYHFVANDRNIFALTKLIIIWKFLTDLSKSGPVSERGRRTLDAILFICGSRIVPRYIYSMLRDAMERILGLISKGVLSLEWLIINESDVPKYIAVLNLWLGIKDFETLTKSDMMQGTQDKFSKLEISPGEERNKEAEFYTKLGSLSPHEKILLCRDPLLFRLSKIKHKPETFPDHIRDNWRFNPIVMNHDVHRDTRRSVLWEKFNCGTDPFDALRQLEESKEGQTSLRLFDDTASFFKRTADSLRYLAPRICVEVLCGDVIEIAEWLRFGVSLTRIPRLEKLPTKFDIIYLTHLPDNIGGHLSKLLYLTPLLRSGKTSVVKSQFSHNVVSWDSTSAFLADCQCITDKKMLERLTQVEVVSEPGKDESAPWTRYTWYRPIPPCSKSHWSNFLPRTEFEKWFCGLFFRLALPYNVDIYPQNTIAFSPVNLTILFHLMNYLCSLQYPHHWMAELLLNIIDNTVISTCRPPRMTPVTVSALKQQHDKRHLCTIPFRHEMATLARIFLPMLPFRLETSSLPAQNDIYRYTFPLTSSTRSPAWPLNLTLVFWCDKYLRELGEVGRESLMNNLRPLLDPTWGDEMNSQFKGANFDAFRKAGVIVWSTIELDVQTWTARVWMPRSLVVSMIQKGERHAGSTWRCGLFRTDTWERCWDSPGLVSDAERGERWEDDVASAEELHCRRISKAASRLMHRTF